MLNSLIKSSKLSIIGVFVGSENSISIKGFERRTIDDIFKLHSKNTDLEQVNPCTDCKYAFGEGFEDQDSDKWCVESDFRLCSGIFEYCVIPPDSTIIETYADFKYSSCNCS